MKLNGRASRPRDPLAPSNIDVHYSIMDLHPKFSLEHLVKQYSLDKCEQEEKAAFADKLFKMSKQIWSQLFQGARHGSGFEKLGKGKNFDWIQDIFQDRNIIAFRFDDRKAMIGFIDREVLYILGLDTKFKAYKH